MVGGIIMSRLIEYFPTNGFGVTEESLIKCDMCGCESCDESELCWQRLGDMDYCPYCWDNLKRKHYENNKRKSEGVFIKEF